MTQRQWRGAGTVTPKKAGEFIDGLVVGQKYSLKVATVKGR
jgi:hypothetical protein